jgi:hypothetical protein
MARRGRAVVTGMIATYPVGGVAWDYGQYLLGLEALGFEVFYLEDTGGPTYDPLAKQYGDDPTAGVTFLISSLTDFSEAFRNRWSFRSSKNETFGLSSEAIEEVAAGADLFLNVSGGTLLRDEYMRCPRKVLIDSDPGWNQFVNYPKWDANPGWLGTHGYRGHDFFFSYAERLGQDDCLLPDMGLPWLPTRPLVAMDRWKGASNGGRWTTVMTWNNFHQPVEYHGRLFGTKELEFPKIEALPRDCPHFSFELAVGGASPPIARWEGLGWRVVDSHQISTTADDYRSYIQSSRGEVSVAKNLYSATRSGWYSCRSACYLAAGLPVVVQDTGFSDYLPCGKGMLSFTDQREAVDAIQEVESKYDYHCIAARELAREYFAADRVLEPLLARIGL